MEKDEQIALFEWAELYLYPKYPELRLLMYHIPNGGSRHPAEAVNLKRQGVKAGVSDIFVSVPRNGFHGLYVEMKYDKNKLTHEQKEFIRAANEQGYGVTVCYTWLEAKTAILNYLGV